MRRTGFQMLHSNKGLTAAGTAHATQQELQPPQQRHPAPPPGFRTLRTSPSLRCVCACALFCSCCTNFWTLALFPLFFKPKVLSSTSLALAFC